MTTRNNGQDTDSPIKTTWTFYN